MAYVLDSNIISYLIKGDKIVREKLKEAVKANEKLVVPHIVYYEIERWLLEKGATAKKAELNKMLQNDLLLEGLSLNVWKKASILYVEARKAGKPIDDNDLIIAAFCIVNGYILVTNNTRHFGSIGDLKYINWK